MSCARYCWLATSTGDDQFGIRPMGRLPREASDAEWTIRFLTKGRSLKVAQIRHSARVSIIFQHDTDDAYVKASGAARLIEGASQILSRWQSGYDTYFPSEEDRANAAFIEIEIDRLELWMRGVTPEPFGLFATIIERAESADWRLAPSAHA